MSMTATEFSAIVDSLRESRYVWRLLRGMNATDREDVLQNALLWCWEHRENASLVTSPRTWAINAVRTSLKRWQRSERRFVLAKSSPDITEPCVASDPADSQELEPLLSLFRRDVCPPTRE